MGLLPKSIAQHFTLLSSILLLLSLCHVTRCKPNTTVKIVQCNIGTYTEGDPFTISLAYVLAELEGVTPARQGYDFRNISPYPNAFAYGHAACNQTLTSSDCAACLCQNLRSKQLPRTDWGALRAPLDMSNTLLTINLIRLLMDPIRRHFLEAAAVTRYH
ncbi:hypothetical protein Sango_0293300 [Sesamum angolense]|uniref:Gnk2-homologous domain-containing protein n=1 Tax=Sesamum angolense TaxID=2727404 RepID=A0AAE1X8D2_9LAMI|nr:hypothetical protein Sango_0293300 [Sesamum angolense]